MEKKNLRKTEGLPFNLGMAAGVALLLESILSFNLSEIETMATLSAMGRNSTVAGGNILVGSIISSFVSFLIYPGIFLLLLILGKNKERRGSAFAIVWIVFSAIRLLSTIGSTLAMKDITLQVAAAVDAAMPGGYWVEFGLGILGTGFMMASCIVFLERLHQPPVLDEQDTSSAEVNQTDAQL